MSKADKLKIIVAGAHGRMGRLTAQLARAANDLTVAAEAEEDQPLEKVINQGDVVIDFTRHDAAAQNAKTAAQYKKPIVIGTTGLNKDEEGLLKQAARVIPIVYAPNMSIGVNLMWKLIKDAAQVLGKNAKIDIVEEHHVHKLDRPSGTAKKMLDIVLAQGELNKERDVLLYEETLPENMPPHKISLGSIRKGEIVGNHTIRFTTEGESLEITHRAFGREVFASGALAAARWIVNKPAGLYNMADVLNI